MAEVIPFERLAAAMRARFYACPAFAPPSPAEVIDLQAEREKRRASE